MNEKMKKQDGVIPVILIVAVAISALIGGWVGFQLGDGTFFSFGVGFGVIFVIFLLLSPYIDTIKEAIRKIRN